MKFVYLLLSLIPISMHATELYTWTDEEGNVQYSQTPPPQNVDMTVKTLPDLPVIEIENKTPNTDSVDKENAELKGKSATEIQDDNCQKARDNLQMLNAKGEQLVVRNSDNPDDFVKLSEEKLQQELTRTQTYLDTYCQQKSAMEK